MTSMRSPLLGVILLLWGCTPDPQAFVEVADVKQLMVSVVEPAAEIYWDAVGTIIDRNGTVEIAPSTDEEWQAVRNAAYVIAESGNLLMMESRAVDTGPWVALSRAMIAAGRVALDAAVAEDANAVFDAGAEVYYTCAGCHATYAREIVRPSDEAEGR